MTETVCPSPQICEISGICGFQTRNLGSFSELKRRDDFLLRSSVAARNLVGIRIRFRTYNASQFRPHKVESYPVVGCVSPDHRSVRNESLKTGAPERLAIVVGTIAHRKKSEAIQWTQFVGSNRIRYSLFKPANRTGADPAQHSPFFPGLAQNAIHAEHAPDEKHVSCVSASDIDYILGE